MTETSGSLSSRNQWGLLAGYDSGSTMTFMSEFQCRSDPRETPDKFNFKEWTDSDIENLESQGFVKVSRDLRKEVMSPLTIGTTLRSLDICPVRNIRLCSCRPNNSWRGSSILFSKNSNHVGLEQASMPDKPLSGCERKGWLYFCQSSYSRTESEVAFQ